MSQPRGFRYEGGRHRGWSISLGVALMAICGCAHDSSSPSQRGGGGATSSAAIGAGGAAGGSGGSGGSVAGTGNGGGATSDAGPDAALPQPTATGSSVRKGAVVPRAKRRPPKKRRRGPNELTPMRCHAFDPI